MPQQRRLTSKLLSTSSSKMSFSTDKIDMDGDISPLSYVFSRIRNGKNLFNEFRKLIVYFKYNSNIGLHWDTLQVALSFLCCVAYVAETYVNNYDAVIAYYIFENITCQFFLIDFLCNWLISSSTYTFLSQLMTWVDILTIAPVYRAYGVQNASVNKIRFIRILRLLRILKSFQLLGALSGIKKQVIYLLLVTITLIFVVTGLINVIENDVAQTGYDCMYINENTNYLPSCLKQTNNYYSSSCDCERNNCMPLYHYRDEYGQPSKIKCVVFPFFQCFYFVIVTVAAVGYGDFSPTSQLSKGIIILFIATSFVVIPFQVNKLLSLISSTSQYRDAYTPKSHEFHIVLCGYVNDAAKVSKILKEFFHPDRFDSTHSDDFHIVILCPTEPTDDMKLLLYSPHFDSRVTYVIGSALSSTGLQKARLDVATAMFFLCNLELDDYDATVDDAATVLRTLSVMNFNDNLRCFVQVLKPQDRELLKDVDVDVVLCLDEYKTSLQAKNAVCPGTSTFVDNLFTTFGGGKKDIVNVVNDEKWTTEYYHGADMEIYQVHFSAERLLEIIDHLWSFLVEAVYLQFGCILFGLISTTNNIVILNPTNFELIHYDSPKLFFSNFNTLIMIAPDLTTAMLVSEALNDPEFTSKVIVKAIMNENIFGVRNIKKNVSTRTNINDKSHLIKAQHVLNKEYCNVRFMTGNKNNFSAYDLKNSFESSKFLGYVEEGSSDEDDDDDESSEPGPVDMSDEGNRVREYDSSEEKTDRAPLKSYNSKSALNQKKQNSVMQLMSNDIERHSVINTSSKDIKQDHRRSSVTGRRRSVQELMSTNIVVSQSSPEKIARNSQMILNFPVIDEKQTSAVETSPVGLDRLSSKMQKDWVRLDSLDSEAIEDLNENNVKNPDSSSSSSMLPIVNVSPALGHFTVGMVYGLKMKTLRMKTNKKHGEHFSPLAIASSASHGTSPGAVPTKINKWKNKSKILLAAARFEKIGTYANAGGVKNIPEENSNAALGPLATASSFMKEKTLKKLHRSGSNSNSSEELSFPSRKLFKEMSSMENIDEKRKVSTKSKRPAFLGDGKLSFDEGSVTLPDPKSKKPAFLRDGKLSFEEGSVTLPDPKYQYISKRVFSRSESYSKKTYIRQDSSPGDIIVPTSVKNSTDQNLQSTLQRSNNLNAKRRGSFDTNRSALENAENLFAFGQNSHEVKDAYGMKNHIIVMGCIDNIEVFITELRRPMLENTEMYHIIVIAHPFELPQWTSIKEQYKDVYFIINSVSNPQDMILLSIETAFSLILLGTREYSSIDGVSSIDSAALFSFLRIEMHVPIDVFFSVDVTNPNNIGVINSVTLRTLRVRDCLAKIEIKRSVSGGSDSGDFDHLAKVLVTKSGSSMEVKKKMAAMRQAERRLSLLKLMPGEHPGLSRALSIGKFNRNIEGSRRTRRKSVEQVGNVAAILKSLASIRYLKATKNNDSNDKNVPQEEEDGLDQMNMGVSGADVTLSLPVYASGRAVSPLAFDSLLVQSCFGHSISSIAEKLVCGQEYQQMQHLDIPPSFFGRYFSDIFRACIARSVLVLGIYRSPRQNNGAILPFVYTCPEPKAVLYSGDKLFVYGNPSTIKILKEALSFSLVRSANGKLTLGDGKLTLGEHAVTTKLARKTVVANIPYSPVGAPNADKREGKILTGKVYPEVEVTASVNKSEEENCVMPFQECISEESNPPVSQKAVTDKLASLNMHRRATPSKVYSDLAH